MLVSTALVTHKNTYRVDNYLCQKCCQQLRPLDISFQLGSEASRNELASKLNTSRKTIERYLDLLEKAFVIYRLKPLTRNQRNEIALITLTKYYDHYLSKSILLAVELSKYFFFHQ